MVRLYIGGLPPDVTAEQLRQRFAPFGSVIACELAPPKVYNCEGQSVFHRGFGHVELLPTDETALKRCMTAYNGSKWKGNVLRCQLARQSGQERLANERAAVASPASANGPEDQEPMQPGPPRHLRLRRPNSHVLVTVTLPEPGQLTISGNAATPTQALSAEVEIPVGQLSWDPLPQPANARYVFEAHLRTVAAAHPHSTQRPAAFTAAAGAAIPHTYSPGSSPAASWQPAAPPSPPAGPAVARKEVHAAVQLVKQLQRNSSGGQPREQAPQQRAAKLRKVVDFMSDDAIVPAGHDSAAGGGLQRLVAPDLSRFDSDSDPERAQEQQPLRHSLRQAAAAHDAAAVRGTPTLRVPVHAPGPALPLSLPPSHQALPAQQHAALRVGAGHSDGDAVYSQGSSGSSGASELEEFLAADIGTDSELMVDKLEDPALSEEMPDGGECLPSRRTSCDDSSSASELEESLIAEGGAGDDSVIHRGGRRGSSSSGGRRAESKDNAGLPVTQQQQQQRRRERGQEALSAAPAAKIQEQRQQATSRPREGDALPAKPLRVVDFLADEDRGILQRKRVPPADLSLFAGSSDEETEGNRRVDGGAGVLVRETLVAPVAAGVRRSRGYLQQTTTLLIPQTDGAADLSSEDSKGGAGRSSDDEHNAPQLGGSQSRSSSSSSESGSQQSSSASDTATSSDNSSHLLAGAAGARVPAERDEVSPDSETDDSDTSGEGLDQLGGAQQPPGREVEAEAEQAHEQAGEDLSWLAAAFPAAASFYRTEPLAQVEAAWRVSHEVQLQALRQQARQARRLHTRATGGSSKRRR